MPDGAVVRVAEVQGVTEIEGLAFCVVWGSGQVSTVVSRSRVDAERARAQVLRAVGAAA